MICSGVKTGSDVYEVDVGPRLLTTFNCRASIEQRSFLLIFIGLRACRGTQFEK